MIKLNKTPRAELQCLRDFAESKLRNAIMYTRDGLGHPNTEALEAFQLIKEIDQSIACDDVMEPVYRAPVEPPWEEKVYRAPVESPGQKKAAIARKIKAEMVKPVEVA
jgi:hypothetical protein